jgi:hypothetical protein
MVKWPLENRKAVVAGGGEAEQAVGPVVDGSKRFLR